MTPHLRTIIDAIESAAGKREASALTHMEKMALCIERGVELVAWSQSGGAGLTVVLETVPNVQFEHDGGKWNVIELK